MQEFIELVQNWVIHQIQNNDIFAGIVGGSVAVSALYYLRSVPPLIGRFLQLQFSVRTVVHNSDEIFYHLESWLGKQPAIRKARRLRLTSGLVGELGPKGTESSEHDAYNPSYSIGPGEGWHWFFFKRRLVIFKREKDDQVNLQTMQVKESFDIIILGRKRRVFEEIVSAAYNASRMENSFKMYTWDGYWSWLRDRQGRSLKSIILPEEQIKRIIDDVDWFCANEKWFFDRGIPYHRGYLFSGPPGTGKTSLATALASYLKRDVYIISLSSMEKDNYLLNAFCNVAKGTILLIEDIDVLPAAHQRTEKVDKVKNKNEPTAPFELPPRIDQDVTLSGLLNSIDGIASPQDCIIIMTTNHPEKLDKAVLRKGRIDIHESIEPLESYLIERMYEMFTGNGENARKLTYDLCERMPAAELQGLLMEHGDNPAAIIKHAPQYFEENAFSNAEKD